MKSGKPRTRRRNRGPLKTAEFRRYGSLLQRCSSALDKFILAFRLRYGRWPAGRNVPLSHRRCKRLLRSAANRLAQGHGREHDDTLMQFIRLTQELLDEDQAKAIRGHSGEAAGRPASNDDGPTGASLRACGQDPETYLGHGW